MFDLKNSLHGEMGHSNNNFTIDLARSSRVEETAENGYDILPVTSTPSPTTSPAPTRWTESERHILISVLVPLVCLVLIAVFAFVVVFLLKKSRLDKLRHHLMPLYNFDPGEEEGDWESELLEEDREQQMALRPNSLTVRREPQLRLANDSMDL